ncbi:MAG: helix-turn-helix transcriptional regulator [Clostridia bacterium]|nr:helix-turn-helix transcriptional regulator [Clostridia bacterium]
MSENIKRLRKEKNLTQEALAEILHISPQSVSK